MRLNQILELKFKDDKYRSGTIRTWIDGEGRNGVVRRQLQGYIASPTVQEEMVDKNFRAFAAVIVGSRQILVREMDRNGNWIGGFQLCERNTSVANKRTSISSEQLVIDSVWADLLEIQASPGQSKAIMVIPTEIAVDGYSPSSKSEDMRDAREKRAQRTEANRTMYFM